MAHPTDGDINSNKKEPVKRTTAKKPDTESGMPSIKLGVEGLDDDNGHPMPGISVDNTHEPERVSMIPGKKLSPSSDRKVVDISEMIPEEVKNRPKETPGVDILESPQAEILKPGGPFDKYVANKKQEMIERMSYERDKEELEKAEAEEQAYLNGTEPPETNIDTFEDENYLSKPSTLRMNVVTRDEEEDSNMIIDDKDNTPEENEEYDIDDTTEEDFSLDDIFNESEADVLEEDDVIEDEVYDDSIDEEPVAASKPTEEVPEITDNDEVDFNTESNFITAEEPEQNTEDTDEVPEEDIDEPKLEAKRISFTFDEDSIEDLEKEIENDTDLPTEDERLEELKADITRKVKPRAQKLNLSGFTVADKATASNKILEIKQASAGKWILPTTGICVEMREISGQKIEYLRENAAANPTASRNALKVLYDHITSPKPQSFEAWTKSIAYADYDHLYMPIYMAAFSHSNYMPITCVMEQGKVAKKETGCGKMFLTDNIDIMKLVKFKDDESKKKFWNLFESDRYNSEGLYVSEILPVSDKFAIKFHEPTLYSVMLEMGAYGNDFTRKYENIIAFMPYIADIYWIDAKRKTLVTVDYKKYTNNASKTAKSKVIRYSNVFDTFSTDEYTNVVSIINAINEKNDWFTYQIPETTCPECGRTIPAEEIGAQGLVFTRHRLGILANTSIK